MTGWMVLAVIVCATAGAAGTIEARSFASGSVIQRWIRSSIIADALVVGSMMLLGATARLTVAGIALVQAVVLALALCLPRIRTVPIDGEGHDEAAGGFQGVPLLPLSIVGALVAFAIAFALGHAPLTLYDSLSYHLFFAARWVQDHAISIIPTPFSDEAQAYAPANGELFLAWLMLPVHSDALARIGQFPFALLAALTLFALARRLGAPTAHAIYPAAFFLLSRPVVEQMIGANVDLICAALFLATLFLVVMAVEGNCAMDWALCGVSAGLFWGTKYLALVYAPVILLLAFGRGPRVRMWWALPAAALFALPWYARNWFVAGSPIYPASLTIEGVTIARGAFGHAAMLNTVFHTSDLTLLPSIVAHAFGPSLVFVWLPCAVAGWIKMARRGWWPHGVLALLPLLMVPLYWYGLPVNIDSRFLMPAVAPALLPLAFVFSSRPHWNVAVHAIYAASMIWVIVGAPVTLPASLPWFMRGWLALDGLIASEYLLLFAGVGTALAVTLYLARRSPGFALSIVAIGIVAIATGISLHAERACSSPCEYLQTTSPYIRGEYLEAWHWLDANLHDSTIAYTGINLPYPLTGERLTNRVVYVAIDGHRRWRLHDYDRAYRNGRFDPRPPLLATSSGELKPVGAQSGPRQDAVRPRYERMQGNPDAWQFSLAAMNVRYVFVAALSAYEVDYVWHNGEGFPIEDDWAKAGPMRFQRLFENGQVHIYEFGQESAQ
ncbi:MAG TPA: glycosyltransferase family 39 protein [Vicinamibacterales bacterium]